MLKKGFFLNLIFMAPYAVNGRVKMYAAKLAVNNKVTIAEYVETLIELCIVTGYFGFDRVPDL